MNIKNNLLRRQPQQKRSQERVERILDAAAIVFDEVGFETATTHDIAARADTAVGSLYQFFPDKLAIFNALELRHIERVYGIWERLLQTEIVKLPFADFIKILLTQFQKLFEQPTSRIVFVQFYTSPKIFKNIDSSFTQEMIELMAQLLKKRNPKLTHARSKLLAEICTHTYNTLMLLALRSDSMHRQEIFREMEILITKYLEAELGDSRLENPLSESLLRLAKSYQLNSRQNTILKYAVNSPEITIKNCEAMFPDVSRRTLQRDLKILIEHKLLLPKGNTDLRCYCFNSLLEN